MITDILSKNIKVLREIITSSVFLAIVLLDLILYGLGLFDKSVEFSSLVYWGLFLLAFLIASLKIIVEKDEQISKSKSEMPILGLYLRHNQIRSGKKISLLRVRNLWVKPIKDIQIKPIETGVYSFKFNLDDTNILKPDEERDLIHSSDTDIGNKLVYPSVFNPKYANADFEMTAEFKDAKDNIYQNKFNLGKSGIKIISSSRVS